MKKSAILSIVSFSMLLVSGCSSNETLFSDMPSENGRESVVNNPTSKNAKPYELGEDFPDIGSTVFAPIKISDGDSTGTFVGQKVISYRKELLNLQDAIRKHNSDLQKIRSSVMSNAAEYHKSVSAVEAKLQIGTTPGNPHVVSALQNAQNNIKTMGDNAIAVNQLSTRVNSDIALTSYVINSINAAYTVSGAVDEDHRQLKMLQNEAEKTNVILNNILNETNRDYSRQQQYIDTANRTILSLEEPVRTGHFNGYSSQNNVKLSPLADITKMSTSEKAFSSRPIFSVKFDKSSVNYREGLNKAVTSALNAKSSMMFNVVAVTPVNASASARNLARTKASEIFQAVVAKGVSPERVFLSAKSNANAKSPEVQVYVK